MKLPPLSVILAVHAVVWCIAGAMVLGPRILLYPLAWGLVGAGFYLHSRLFPWDESALANARARAVAQDATKTADAQELAAS